MKSFSSPPPKEPADKKIAELEEKLKTLEKSAQEEKNNFLRAVADLENYKKRVVKERQEWIDDTASRLLRELLEVKDHLELAVQHAEGGKNLESLQEGVTLTLKQMDQFLEKFGVETLQSVGKPFDPNFHEAIQAQESDQSPPGSVVSEYQKGYLHKGRLLRAAKVIVAKEKKS